jgi:hypothetical protein
MPSSLSCKPRGPDLFASSSSFAGQVLEGFVSPVGQARRVSLGPCDSAASVRLSLGSGDPAPPPEDRAARCQEESESDKQNGGRSSRLRRRSDADARSELPQVGRGEGQLARSRAGVREVVTGRVASGVDKIALSDLKGTAIGRAEAREHSNRLGRAALPYAAHGQLVRHGETRLGGFPEEPELMESTLDALYCHLR